MFVNAIEEASQFTRPILTISRNYPDTIIHPGAATLFFINSDGWAMTCKHVAQLLIQSSSINTNYSNFKQELQNLVTSGKKEKHARKELERKYKYSRGITVQIKNTFIDCIEGTLNAKIESHPTLDLSLIKFSDCEIRPTKFPRFPKDTSIFKPGKSICRLGYPFPEFTNFKYTSTSDDIEWDTNIPHKAPRFPIEGMVTRLVSDSSTPQSSIVGFELSTPGLRGQSGGPAFDKDGIIWGMQSQTVHLHLGFDVEQQVYIKGQKVLAEDHAFLHVGRCIYVDQMKDFMKLHNVTFNEA